MLLLLVGLKGLKGYIDKRVTNVAVVGRVGRCHRVQIF